MTQEIEVDLMSLSILDDHISFGRYERAEGKYVHLMVWRDEPDTEGNREIYPTIYSEDKEGNEIGMPMDEYIKYTRLVYKHVEIAKEMWGMES